MNLNINLTPEQKRKIKGEDSKITNVQPLSPEDQEDIAKRKKGHEENISVVSVPSVEKTISKENKKLNNKAREYQK